jgi:hypothetical protein
MGIKAITGLVLGMLLVGVPLLSFAETPPATGGAVDIQPLTNIPGLTDGGINTTDLSTFFNTLYKYGVGLAGTLAVIFLMYYGFQYMTSQTPFKLGQSKDRLWEIFIGLLIVLTPIIVFGIINPKIFSFNVELFKSLALPQDVTSGPRTTNPTTGDAANECIGPSQIVSGSCSTLGNGHDWFSVTSSCCTGTVGNGQTCCQLIPNLISRNLAGQIVTSDAEKDACLDQGLFLKPQPSSPGSFLCQTTDPNINNPDAPDGQGTITRNDGSTLNFKNFPTPGTSVESPGFVILLGTPNDPAHSGCLYTGFKSFTSSASCQSELSAARAANPNWQTLAACSQNINQFFGLQTTQTICTDSKGL